MSERTVVAVSLSPEEIAALDSYRDAVGEILTRSTMARILIRDALRAEGFLPPKKGARR